MQTLDEPLDILMISEQPTWPLDQGFRVHGYQMLRSLERLGVRVKLASMQEAPKGTPRTLKRLMVDWPASSAEHVATFQQGWSGVAAMPRRRLARYLGPEVERMAGAVALMERYRPAVVLGLGIHAPLLLRGLSRMIGLRVWYAADELTYFHLSCLRREAASRWPGRLWNLAQHAAMEELFARGLDGAIGVSPRDTALLRHVAGVKRAVTIRNGVDLDQWSPRHLESAPGSGEKSVIFWGRLDFEPNVDAVLWFARHVWPALRDSSTNATWRIVGKNPVASVSALARLPGVELTGEVADIRPVAQRSAVAILPMRCGGGIKNKLLEAAALGRPIVASRRAVDGLEIDAMRPAVLVCDEPGQWVTGIKRLWSDTSQAHSLGRNARLWVEEKHDWSEAARKLMAWLSTLPGSGVDEAQWLGAAGEKDRARRAA